MKPIIIDLFLTYHCNLHCLHCCHNAGPHRNEFMTMEQVNFVDSWMKELKMLGHHIRAIGFTGGEPTLHPQFRDIINLLVHHKRSSRFGLLTNGTRDIDANIGRLFDPITVSFDVFHRRQTDIGANINRLIETSKAILLVDGQTYRDKGRCKNIVKDLVYVKDICTHKGMTNDGNIIRISFDPMTIRFCLENSLYKKECPENFVGYDDKFLEHPIELLRLAENFTLNHSGNNCKIPCKYYKK